jgi:uncharacterized protein with HEPN domain
MGEGAARVSPELKSAHPEVEWRTVIGMRNIVVHEYFAISWQTVLATARSDIPDLGRRIREVLESLGD